MKKALLAFMALSCQFLFAQNIVYVNHAATGANDGSSWTNAYTDLQTAVDLSQTGSEIWVAQGEYYPMKDRYGNINPVEPRNKIFTVLDSMAIYGGFTGLETTREQRDWVMNTTILSGDIGVKGLNTDNTYSVIFLGSFGAILDGFTISHANSKKTTSSTVNDGVIIVGTANRLVNLHITNNIGYGMRLAYDHPAGKPVYVINCKINDNDKLNRPGGGLVFSTQNGSMVMINCLITNNYSSNTLGNNSSHKYEVLVSGSKVWIYNSTIGNEPSGFSLYNSSVDVAISNSIFTDSVSTGTGSYMGDFHFSNSIVPYSGAGTPSGWSYHGTDLGGNIDADPLLKTDYSLSYNSPAINAGNNDSIPYDLFDMDNDGMNTDRLPYDLVGNKRVIDNKLDMGAYEFLESWSDTINQAICPGKQAFFHGKTYYAAGIYRHGASPDTARYLNLTIDKPDVYVDTWFGGILIARANDVNYEWIDCQRPGDNLNATNKVFEPASPGYYAVVITTKNGCVDTSSCFWVSNIGLPENAFEKEISIYPNPVDGLLHVAFSEEKMDKQTVLKVLDVNGKTVLQRVIATKGEKEIALDVESLAKGVYFLKVGSSVLRFVKE